MKRPTVFLLSLFISSIATAARFDVRVSLDAPAQSRPGQTLSWNGIVENLGPDAAENVNYSFSSYDGQSGQTCVENSPLARLGPGERHVVHCERTLDATSTEAVFLHGDAFAAHSSTDDLNRDNDQTFTFVYLVDTPDLSVAIQQGQPYVTPGLPFEAVVSFGNRGIPAANGVKLAFASPDVSGYVDLPENCTATGGRAVCTFDSLEPAFVTRTLTLKPIAIDEPRTTIHLTASIDGREEDPHPANDTSSHNVLTYDTRFVTNTNDAGSGSLRRAIEEFSTRCRDVWPCEIAFRIAPQGQRWVTIQPETPLPPVKAMFVRIDGTTQTRFFGDTNPDGPEVELNGARAGNADGLSLTIECLSLVRGLAINGFAGNGVYATSGLRCELQQALSGIEQSYIGTDATGMQAVPNFRGVFVEKLLQFTPFGIDASIVGGNVRSGIFVWTRGAASISNSRIGINRTLTGPLSNGASGVYVHENTYANLTDSHVSFNTEFGVSVGRGGKIFSTGNSFQANHQLAIDHGLDGPSSGALPIPPEVLSARYDPATDITTIEGALTRPRTFPFDQVTVSVYANDAADPSGYGEGQYYLGRVTIPLESNRFTLRYAGDLRGKSVTATTTHVAFLVFAATSAQQFPPDTGSSFGTSEFSRAIEVTP